MIDLSLDEQFELVSQMPINLIDTLLEDDVEPEDLIELDSHICQLKKIKQDDEDKWICSRAKNDKECLSGIEKPEDSVNAIGWKCRRGENCEEGDNVDYFICKKCLKVELLAKKLQDESKKACRNLIKNCKYIFKILNQTADRQRNGSTS